MPDRVPPNPPGGDLGALRERVHAARELVASTAAELGPAIEPVLRELEDLAGELSDWQDSLETDTASSERRDSATRDRQLLRALFLRLPVAVFLLDRLGVIRRVNERGCDLLGVPNGYATGKPLPVFVDLAGRAALRATINRVRRAGAPEETPVTLLGEGAPRRVVLRLAPLEVATEPDPVLVVTALPTGRQPTPTEGPGATAIPTVVTPAGPVADRTRDTPSPGSDRTRPVTPPPDRTRTPTPPAESVRAHPDDPAERADALGAAAHRLDVMSAMTRTLLGDTDFLEPALLRRAANLLASEFADWVLLDVLAQDRIRRRVALGPPQFAGGRLAAVAHDADPGQSSLISQVLDSGEVVLVAHVDDVYALGKADDGTGLCALLGATSMLSVPLLADAANLGAVTLIRTNRRPPFDLADAGLVRQLAGHLALAIRADRTYQRRAEVADALQSSLLPRRLPALPGLDVAASYYAGTVDVEVGGDFYDVFPSGDGWGLVLGDVCGKGEQAATVTAAVRQAIRVLGLRESRPDEILRQAHEFLRAQHDTDRFVTAVTAHVAWHGGSVLAVISSAGHPVGQVLRRDGELVPTGGGGRPLGLLDDARPSRTKVTLRPGDGLVLYSDGVTDARDRSGETFGEDRLAEVLVRHHLASATQIATGIADAVMSFCGGRLRDDVSVLVLRVNEPPGRSFG